MQTNHTLDIYDTNNDNYQFWTPKSSTVARCDGNEDDRSYNNFDFSIVCIIFIISLTLSLTDRLRRTIRASIY